MAKRKPASAPPSIGVRLDPGLKMPMPHRISPMLATLTDECFDHQDWLYEMKWDGYRAVAELRDGHVDLYSRNLLPFNKAFPGIVEELKTIPGDMIFDGEIIAVDDNGKPNFGMIQDRENQQHRMYYYVFDLIYCNGHDLRSLPLVQRKAILEKVLPDNLERIKYSAHQFQEGCALFNLVEAERMEGLIAKDANSPYVCGKRTRYWLKIKTKRQQDAIIVGYTEPQGGRSHLGALVLAVRETGGKEKYRYIGHTGTGFNSEMLKKLKGMLEPLETDKSPFSKMPAIKRKDLVHWVKPKYVCTTEFQEWTNDMHMRHPVFMGLLKKSPDEVFLDVS